MDFNIIFPEQDIDSASLQALQQQQQSLQDDHQRQPLLTQDQNLTAGTSSGFQLPDPYTQPFYTHPQAHQTGAGQASQADARFAYSYYPVDAGNLGPN